MDSQQQELLTQLIDWTTMKEFITTSGVVDSSFVMTAVTDIFLFGTNLFNLFIYTLIVIPGYNPYKKFMIKMHRNIVKPIHGISFLTTVVNYLLLVLSIYYIYLSITVDADPNNNKNKGALIRAIVSSYTFLSVLLLQKLSNYSLALGEDRVLEIETEVDQIETIINFTPPSKALVNTVVQPTNAFLRPEATGLNNIPTDRPAFYVMNHSLYGIEMLPFINMIYQEKDVYVRGLGDHMHFTLPYADLIRFGGAVDGTRANLDVLMETKQNVLVYPGGGNEILKHSSVPSYTLMWKERLGFARMAIKHRYPIMPCAAVGTEDIFDIMMDIPTPKKGLTVPISKPISPHRLQKVYFWFGKPIETAQYNGDWKNNAFAKEVRDKTKAAIEEGIRQMQEKQQNDPDRFLIHQWANTICKAKEDALDVFTTSVWGNDITEGEANNTTLTTAEEETGKEKKDK